MMGGTAAAWSAWEEGVEPASLLSNEFDGVIVGILCVARLKTPVVDSFVRFREKFASTLIS